VKSTVSTVLLVASAAAFADCGVAAEHATHPTNDGAVDADPFAAPPICTSMTLWTMGSNPSPLMQPGQPCIACHKGYSETPSYVIAGTLYPTAHEPDECYGTNGNGGAIVVITGSDGASISLTPNVAGAFTYEGTVAVPYAAEVRYRGRVRAMIQTQVLGDCNGCHTQAGTNLAPGRILTP
jgi:hypothetical protein